MAAATKPTGIRRTRDRSKTKDGRRLNITIIGAGRLGTALGRALQQAGHRIELVVANHPSHARRAAALIGVDLLAVSASGLRSKKAARDRLLRSNVILVSTPDDALPRVTQQLSSEFRRSSRGSDEVRTRVALHTSGVTSSDVLAPLRSVGLAVGSFHPLVAVADTAPADAFRGVHVCLEGDPKAARVAKALVRDLRGHSFTIDASRKGLYHAAAVMSAGHVVALFDLAIKMLVECGLSPQKARQVLLPLLKSTTANLAKKNPAEALTGPFARGDVDTVAMHLKAISATNISELEHVYAFLGRRALKLRAPTSGSQPANRIARLLKKQM